MTKLHGSWIWYELLTTDPTGAKAFYEAVVGWQITPGTQPPLHYGMIANADGAFTGGLLPITLDMASHGTHPGWLGYIGVNDCDAAVAAVTARDGKILMAPTDIPEAGRIALVTDCGGAPFYVMTPAPHPGGGEITAFSETLVGRCRWNELCAGHAADAIGFYTELFGWSLPEPMDMGAMGKYQFIAHEGVTLGAIMQNPPESPTPHWNHYFRVASITGAAQAIPANGGQVINGPMEVPGGEWIIHALDPQGAFFSLVG